MRSNSHHSPVHSHPARTSTGPASGGASISSSVPSKVSGTTRKLTSGTATRFDKAPTNEVPPKNHRLSGSSATAISACASVNSRNKPRHPEARDARPYIRKATPAKDSQKPALNTDNGSTTSIANKASASDCAGET